MKPVSDAGDSDGRSSVHHANDPKTNGDRWVVPVSEPRTQAPCIGASFGEGSYSLSTDGRGASYASDEPGGLEIQVASFLRASRKWQVSAKSGVQAQWRTVCEQLGTTTR